MTRPNRHPERQREPGSRKPARRAWNQPAIPCPRATELASRARLRAGANASPGAPDRAARDSNNQNERRRAALRPDRGRVQPNRDAERSTPLPEEALGNETTIPAGEPFLRRYRALGRG